MPGNTSLAHDNLLRRPGQATTDPRPDQVRSVRRAARGLLRLSRPYQWVKNPVTIALPALVLHRWTLDAATAVFWATTLFVLASVLVYALNDIVDLERDRLDPAKRRRPLPSGDLPVAGAWWLLAIVTVTLATGVWLASPARSWPVLAYVALNLAYSLRLKHAALVDAFAVSTGFVLRAAMGYLVLDTTPAPWLLLAVLTSCLLLALGKRRRELAGGPTAHRPALTGYSVQLLDYLMLTSAALSAMSFGAALTAAPSPSGTASALVTLTVALTVFALFRYLQLLVVGGGSPDPVRTLFQDPLLIGSGLGCVGLLTVLS